MIMISQRWAIVQIKELIQQAKDDLYGLLIAISLWVWWNIHAFALLSASTIDFLYKRCYI